MSGRLLSVLVACAVVGSACHGSGNGSTTPTSRVTGDATGGTGTGGTAGTSTTGGTAGGGSTAGGTTGPVDGLGPDVQANCVTAGKVDVNVTVTTKLGPAQVDAGGHATHAAAPIAVTNNVYSQGIYDLSRADYDPQWCPDPSDAANCYSAARAAPYEAYLKALRPGMLRFPAGYRGQRMIWSRTAKDDGSSCCWVGGDSSSSSNLTPGWVDAFVGLCRRIGAQPYLAVNMQDSAATAQQAADMVRYVNVEKKYGVTWWQLGNEPDLDGNLTPASYAAKVVSWASAMRAVDPTIKFVGGVFYNGIHVTGKSDGSEVDWLTPMLDGLKAGGGHIDAFDWHYYPLYSGETVGSPLTGDKAVTIANILRETDTSGWPPAGLDYADMVMPGIAQHSAAYPAQMGGAQVWMDEVAEDSGNSLSGKGVSDVVGGALWAADMLGRYMDYGVAAQFKFIYSAPGTFAYTLVDNNYTPRPEYYAYWLYAQHFGDQMVAADSDQRAQVAAHAAVRASDGSVRLVLVNKQSTAQQVRVHLADYAPRMAGTFVLQGSGASSTQATINGQALSMANVGQANTAIPAANAQACADHILTVPAYAVQLVVFATHP